MTRPTPTPTLLHKLLRGPGVWQDTFFDKNTFLLQDPQSVALTDLSDNAVTATLTGSASLATAGPWSLSALIFARNTANYGQRYELSGGIAAATLDLLAHSTWSVEGWFVVDNIGRQQALWTSWWKYGGFPFENFIDQLYAWTYVGALAPHVGLDVTAAGLLRLRVQNGTDSPITLTSAAPVTAGVPFYARASRQGGSLRLYLNGASVTSSATPVRPADAPLFQLAGLPYGTARRDVQLVGKVLSLRVTQNAARPLDYAPYRQLPFFVRRSTYAPSAAPGQQVVTTSGATLTVPSGVTRVSIVCVGMRAHIGSTTLVQAKRGAIVGTGHAGGDVDAMSVTYSQVDHRHGGFGGGGGGGNLDWYEETSIYRPSGGGGAGGYLAAGGRGRVGAPGEVPPAGSGAGSGGGNPNYSTVGSLPGGGASLRGLTPGGGTLYGGGAAGIGCTAYYNSKTGESTVTGAEANGGPGASLAYANEISVSPGQVITFTTTSEGAASVAARVMWGAARSYPNDAGDV